MKILSARERDRCLRGATDRIARDASRTESHRAALHVCRSLGRHIRSTSAENGTSPQAAGAKQNADTFGWRRRASEPGSRCLLSLPARLGYCIRKLRFERRERHLRARRPALNDVPALRSVLQNVVEDRFAAPADSIAYDRFADFLAHHDAQLRCRRRRFRRERKNGHAWCRHRGAATDGEREFAPAAQADVRTHCARRLSRA